ncbi:MAG: hypothetical protein FJX92_06405 [Bacteroidetes bacterium]|nr:hypothetical protein [Bacteroidota bacterium]
MKYQNKWERLFSLVLGLLVAIIPIRAQYHGDNSKIEIGYGVGPMFTLTDLGGTVGIGRTFLKDLNVQRAKVSTSAYLSVHPSEWFSLRVTATLGGVAADDTDAPNTGGAESFRYKRNLHFRSRIQEVQAALEFYPFTFFVRSSEFNGKIRPYVVGGVGLFHFNPEVKDVDGRWVKTHELRLEGQGFAEYPNSKPYQLIQTNLMSGAGFKFYVNNSMCVGAEVLYRKLMTDHLDDASQNYYINPVYFDQYLTPDQAQQARRLYYRGTYSYATNRPYTELDGRGDPTENDSYFTTTIRVLETGHAR